MSVIKSEAAVQQSWESIAASHPAGDLWTINDLNQAWRSCSRRSDIWELLKASDRDSERQNGDWCDLTDVISEFDWFVLSNVLVGSRV